jgi:hypothetical protein
VEADVRQGPQRPEIGLEELGARRIGPDGATDLQLGDDVDHEREACPERQLRQLDRDAAAFPAEVVADEHDPDLVQIAVGDGVLHVGDGHVRVAEVQLAEQRLGLGRALMHVAEHPATVFGDHDEPPAPVAREQAQERLPVRPSFHPETPGEVRLEAHDERGGGERYAVEGMDEIEAARRQRVEDRDAFNLGRYVVERDEVAPFDAVPRLAGAVEQPGILGRGEDREPAGRKNRRQRGRPARIAKRSTVAHRMSPCVEKAIRGQPGAGAAKARRPLGAASCIHAS